MKKIYLYVAFALASIGMISCTDILDQDPLDSFTDEAVWNDLALSETYLNAQYMNLMAENMKGTRFAHYTDEVFQKHTYGSENVTQGLLSCDNAGIGWDDTMWDPWYSYYQYISKETNTRLHLLKVADGWGTSPRYVNFDFSDYTYVAGVSFVE